MLDSIQLNKIKKPFLNTPKNEKTLFIKRPMTKERPSPYEPQRNFRVLKDFFQVQIIDNQVPNYAISNDGQFLYNTNMMKLNGERNNRDLPLNIESSSQPELRVKTSLGAYRSTSPKMVKTKVVIGRKKNYGN
mmetsp:Transcript_2986/g.2465  ORF Transcript_2986/g.2465 Transcript_2986/m.2465 type:complete len:133 (-) Transcript_2986:386-784(-)